MFYLGLILFIFGIGSLLYMLILPWKSVGFIRWKYPRSKLGKSFQIIESDRRRGKLYLYDLKTNTKYWIASGQTYRDLGYFWGDAVTLAHDNFDKIPEGPLILTSGNPGEQ